MTTKVDVIIPARNEARTIGGVVDAFERSPNIGNILVGIDPATTDDTALEIAGRYVFWRICKKPGKGQVVAEMLDYVETEHIALCDADLTGLTPDHVQEFVCACNRQTIGVLDYPLLSPVPWPVRPDVYAQMSGQRSLPTEIVRSVTLHGYTMEAFLNRAVEQAGLETVYRQLGGVTGKVRNNEQRMRELRRDREWLERHWQDGSPGGRGANWKDTIKQWWRS